MPPSGRSKSLGRQPNEYKRVYAFGSCTKRDLSYLDALPYEFRIYDAPTPTHEKAGKTLADFLADVRSETRTQSSKYSNQPGRNGIIYAFGSRTPREFDYLVCLRPELRVYDVKLWRKRGDEDEENERSRTATFERPTKASEARARRSTSVQDRQKRAAQRAQNRSQAARHKRSKGDEERGSPASQPVEHKPRAARRETRPAPKPVATKPTPPKPQPAHPHAVPRAVPAEIHIPPPPPHPEPSPPASPPSEQFEIEQQLSDKENYQPSPPQSPDDINMQSPSQSGRSNDDPNQSARSIPHSIPHDDDIRADSPASMIDHELDQPESPPDQSDEDAMMGQQKVQSSEEEEVLSAQHAGATAAIPDLPVNMGGWAAGEGTAFPASDEPDTSISPARRTDSPEEVVEEEVIQMKNIQQLGKDIADSGWETTNGNDAGFATQPGESFGSFGVGEQGQAEVEIDEEIIQVRAAPQLGDDEPQPTGVDADAALAGLSMTDAVIVRTTGSDDDGNLLEDMIESVSATIKTNISDIADEVKARLQSTTSSSSSSSNNSQKQKLSDGVGP